MFFSRIFTSVVLYFCFKIFEFRMKEGRMFNSQYPIKLEVGRRKRAGACWGYAEFKLRMFGMFISKIFEFRIKEGRIFNTQYPIRAEDGSWKTEVG